MSEKKPSYWEQLRDPRWQKMRLEVMERHKWTCQSCGDKTTTFNVHHSYYERGLAPWEYPPESLRCFCEPCHEKAQEKMKELNRHIGMLGELGLEILVGFVIGMRMDLEPDNRFVLGPPAQVTGIAMSWGVDEEMLWEYSSWDEDSQTASISGNDIRTYFRECKEASDGSASRSGG